MTAVWATTFPVTTTANTGPGSLRQAILDANADNTATADNPHVINITSTGTITLEKPFLVLTNHITIQGPGQTSLTISGANATRIFWLQNGTITIRDVTMADGLAKGGDGGGGGMGAGGAIFMHEGREGGSGSLSVKLINVTLNNNKAVGGTAISSSDGYGPGGGMGGDGVRSGGGGVLGMGGGGGGGSVEDASNSAPGGNGGIPIFGNGGWYGSGAGGFGGGGGNGLQARSVETSAPSGGAGGFGGGGGEGGIGYYEYFMGNLILHKPNGAGGIGGFGGGGGNSPGLHATAGGRGGFGGGGGYPYGSAGFGGGEGGGRSDGRFEDVSGGGGMGAGGAIFVASGALQLVNVSFTGNTAIAEYNPYGGGGSAFGGAIFIFNKADNYGYPAPGTTNDPTVSGCNFTFTNNEAREGYQTKSDNTYGTISGYTGSAITQQPLSGTAICPGGSATTSVSVEGTGPFSYQWYKDGQNLGAAQRTATLSLTNLQASQAGSYSVVITGECTSLTSTAFSLTVNSAPVPTLSVSGTLTCAQTSVTLTVGGGSSYQFSGQGILNQNSSSGEAVVNATGTYSVTVTSANGCTAETSVTVSEDITAPQPLINPSSYTLSCATPSVSLTASGGVSYRWENGSSNPVRTVSKAGTYSVTVTSANGCPAVANVQISGSTAPASASITASAIWVSTGQSVTLTASGGTSYQWNTGGHGNTVTVIPPTGTSVYSVTVTDAAGCSGTASISITATEQIQVTGPASLCVKTSPPARDQVSLPLTMTVIGAPAAYVYTWSYKTPKSTKYKAIEVGGTSIGTVEMLPVAGEPELTIKGAKGNLNSLQGYRVRMTVTLAGQMVGSAETLLDGSCPVGSSNSRLGALSAETVQVLIYPNPVADRLQVEIRGLGQTAKVGIFDLQGRQQGQWTVEPVEGAGQLNTPLSDLPGGLYLLQVETANGVLHRQRVLKH
ncbi:hypothetical protein GCM10023189_18870 [Nibrella saemangeumensis]|uniref:Ig-like domain-containing protein n=1 Tax=Nibrella saemangeumensis TaxID=1084526 RepID=A0ABP8MSI0_9BACT